MFFAGQATASPPLLEMSKRAYSRPTATVLSGFSQTLFCRRTVWWWSLDTSVYIPKVNHHSEWCIRPVARAWQVELLITRPTHAATDHTRNISILAEATWTHERVNTPAWQQLKACICLGPHPRHNKSGAFHSTDPLLLTQSQDSGYTLFWWSVATNSHWSVRLVG